MEGIIIGGGTKCKCYNNIIKDGKGSGINVFGLGDIYIFNNLIVNMGLSSKMSAGQPDNHHPIGIFATTELLFRALHSILLIIPLSDQEKLELEYGRY